MGSRQDRWTHSFSKTAKFLTKDIWQGNFSELDKIGKRTMRYLRVIVSVVRNFGGKAINREAVFLSYQTIMAFVPFVALAIFFTNGLGLSIVFADTMYNSFPNQSQLIDTVFYAANNILDTTNSGLFGVISFLCFVWLVFWMMVCVDRAFNRIFVIKRRRSFWKELVAILATTIISPLVILLFLYTAVHYASSLDSLFPDSSVIGYISSNLYWVLFYAATVVIFVMMYKLIPHNKVSLESSFKAALVAALFFVVLQYLYLETQLMVTRMNSVYGAFAFFPLLLIWMSFNWRIILIGADLSYSFQEVDREIENEIDREMDLEKQNNIDN